LEGEGEGEIRRLVEDGRRRRSELQARRLREAREKRDKTQEEVQKISAISTPKQKHESKSTRARAREQEHESKSTRPSAFGWSIMVRWPKAPAAV